MTESRAKRRTLLALGASLGVHVLAGTLIVASSLWGAWRRPPIDVEITGMRLEDLKDLPLGSPSSGPAKTDGVSAPPTLVPAPRPTVKRPRRDAPGDERPPGSVTTEAKPAGGPTPPRPTSVRSYAPAGSRVSALLRVDRLRGTPYAPVVDALLMNLPDRRDLLEGTGLDLYRDVDAVLIATPNPLDATVTFLAVRHRLSDPALRAALDRGARATGRRLTWRTERGRPFAERGGVAVAVADAAIGRGGAGASPADPPVTNRDHRLILLAAPKLVVVTPPAYRNLILRGTGASGSSPASRASSPSEGTKPDGGSPEGAGDSDADAGAGLQERAAASAVGANDWALLIRRIDAEDSIMPPDAVAMVSAADLFSARSLRGAVDIVPGTRGATDDDGPHAAGPTFMGLPVPPLLTATMGILPQPFADLDATFAHEADAERWEEEFPKLRRKLLINPLVVLSGFGGLISHAVLARTGANIHVRIDATELEATRLLQIVASQLPASRREQ